MQGKYTVRALHLPLSLATVLAWTCAVGQTDPSASEKMTVRLEVDFDGAAPGSITPQQLAKWSSENFVVRAFDDRAYGLTKVNQGDASAHIATVMKRNLTKTNPNAAQLALAMNSPRDAGVPEWWSPSDGSSPLFVAPLGTSRINPKAAPGGRFQPVITYMQANPQDIARLAPGAAEDDRFQVLVPDLAEPAGGFPKRVSVQLDLTRAQLASLRREFPSSAQRIVNGTFSVVFDAAKVARPKSLGNEDRKVLDAAFRASPHAEAKPLLIVVDDSWPTDNDFLATKNLIGSVFPLLWKINSDVVNYAPVPELPGAVKRLATPGVPNGSGCVALSDCETHAARVQRAIAPLRQYAVERLGKEPVDVIFIPLGKSQQGAAEILSLLWNLAYKAGTNLASGGFATPVEEATRKQKEQEFLRSLQPTHPSGTFQTNWGLLDAVTYFSRQYAQLRQVPVFISLSWTTEDTSFNPSVLTEWNTLIVAAAGNHCPGNRCTGYSDQTNPQRLFITRAERPIDVLLVVNVDANGNLTCNSSRVRTNYTVVGFDGALDGDCGTSYATPRVAWLLAARAALERAPFTPKEQINRLKWLMSLDSRKKCAGDGDYKCIKLTTADLLSAPLRSKP